jgi:hypothetical protein
MSRSAVAVPPKKLMSRMEWEATLLDLQEETLALNRTTGTEAEYHASKHRLAEQRLTDHFNITEMLLKRCADRLRHYALKNNEPDPAMWTTPNLDD